MPERAENPEFTVTLSDGTDLDEIFQFWVENQLPEWKLHPGAPAPNRFGPNNSLQFYSERGNPIQVCRDQNGAIWGTRILSMNSRNALWANFPLEDQSLRLPLNGVPNKGWTPNGRRIWAEFWAHQWSLLGERYFVMPPSENGLVLSLLFDNEGMQEGLDLADAIYAEKYA